MPGVGRGGGGNPDFMRSSNSGGREENLDSNTNFDFIDPPPPPPVLWDKYCTWFLARNLSCKCFALHRRWFPDSLTIHYKFRHSIWIWKHRCNCQKGNIMTSAKPLLLPLSFSCDGRGSLNALTFKCSRRRNRSMRSSTNVTSLSTCGMKTPTRLHVSFRKPPGPSCSVKSIVTSIAACFNHF